MKFSARKDGAPEEIRTPDPQIRSLVLYPAELRARMPPCGEAGEIAEAAVPRNPLLPRKIRFVRFTAPGAGAARHPLRAADGRATRTASRARAPRPRPSPRCRRGRGPFA